MKTKIVFLSRRLTPLAKLLYEHFIHLTTPQHTPFEQSTACLLVFLELLPGLLPFAILWHVGRTLEKNHLHEHELQLSDCNI